MYLEADTKARHIFLALHICLLPALMSLVPVANRLGSSDNVPWLAEDRLIAVRDRSKIDDRISLGHL